MTHPILDNRPINLGDILIYAPGTAQALEVLIEDGALVKGWSPCGQFVYLGWAGIVPLADCSWADPQTAPPLERLYKVPTENKWEEAVKWGLAKDAIARGVKIPSSTLA